MVVIYLSQFKVIKNELIRIFGTQHSVVSPELKVILGNSLKSFKLVLLELSQTLDFNEIKG